jgi:antitoxin MazE
MLTQKILRWGNSLAVRLPKNLADMLKLTEGASVKLDSSRGRLIIERLPEPRKELDELIAGITPGNRHPETETDKSVGREQW